MTSSHTPPEIAGPPHEEPERGPVWRSLGLAAGLAVFALAAVSLYHILEAISWPDLKAALEAVTPEMLAGAAFGTVLSYAALAGYDALAARHLGITALQLPRIAFTAFVAQAFSFTLGFGVLSGGAVRLGLYGEAGVEPGDVAALSLVSALVFWLGLAVLSAVTLLLAPTLASEIDTLPAWLNEYAGAALLVAIAAFAVWTSTATRRLTIKGWQMALPDWRILGPAAIVGALDTCAAAFALYALLPDALPLGFVAFLPIFVLATAAGVVSHVPGGLGVFEAVMIIALPTEPTAGLVGALLLFRIIYYVVPFLVAAGLLAATEAVIGSRFVRLIGPTLVGLARPIAPITLALAVFLGGVVLLLSGALPAEHDRLHIVRHVVPLPFVEASHLLASIVGFTLLIVAVGLANRLAPAWRAAIGMLLAGAVFSLLKGFDYEEAAICLVVAAMLYAARREFYRRERLADTPLPLDWIVAIVIVIGASVWLGFFAFRNVDYDNDLWWSFAYRGDAPRFLRATLAIAVVAIGFGVYRLTHRRPQRRSRVDPEQWRQVEAVAAASPRTDAQLAFLGDKSFLLDKHGEGFVMYGIEGRSLIAMADPIAASDERVAALIWDFAELADREFASAVFYQATRHYVPAYLDAGFSLVKLGEEAWVDLEAFTLEGSKGRKLRQTKTKTERQGLALEIVPAAELDGVIGDMRAVSDAWLGPEREEKGFSLGFWSEPYLRRYDAAIIRHEGRIVGFANIWRSADKAEYSVDLMRHAPDAPPGTMDALFITLMQLAKTEGYRWFNLGMAPLAGQPSHRLAPAWARIANFVYRHGDRFYNFEGLRNFKEKFEPQWRPRYLAYRGSASLARILIDATRLIAASPDRAKRSDA